MISFWFLVNFVFLVLSKYAICSRDFYIGFMYHPNATLVAQDLIYKAANPFGFATASYGRLFKCEISYFRVVDRLGIGKGPHTQVVRGGIGKKYIAVRIKSTYKLPLSVNIYVACVKKQKPRPKGIISTTQIITTHKDDDNKAGNTTDGNGTDSNGTDTGTPVDNSTTSNDGTGGGNATTQASDSTGGGGDTTASGEAATTPV